MNDDIAVLKGYYRGILVPQSDIVAYFSNSISDISVEDFNIGKKGKLTILHVSFKIKNGRIRVNDTIEFDASPTKLESIKSYNKEINKQNTLPLYILERPTNKKIPTLILVPHKCFYDAIESTTTYFKQDLNRLINKLYVSTEPTYLVARLSIKLRGAESDGTSSTMAFGEHILGSSIIKAMMTDPANEETIKTVNSIQSPFSEDNIDLVISKKLERFPRVKGCRILRNYNDLIFSTNTDDYGNYSLYLKNSKLFEYFILYMAYLHKINCLEETSILPSKRKSSTFNAIESM